VAEVPAGVLTGAVPAGLVAQEVCVHETPAAGLVPKSTAVAP